MRKSGQLKTPYSESLPHERSECFGYGTTHVIFEPLDFIGKLAALVPKPRVNLTRFHGVFAGAPDRPNSKHRSHVTPARRGKDNPSQSQDDKTPEQRHKAMTCTRGHKGATPKAGVQHRRVDLSEMRRRSQGDGRYAGPLYRGSTGHRQDTEAFTGQGRITSTAGSVTCYAGLPRCGLVGIGKGLVHQSFRKISVTARTGCPVACCLME
jgi:hypothetical protein